MTAFEFMGRVFVSLGLLIAAVLPMYADFVLVPKVVTRAHLFLDGVQIALDVLWFIACLVAVWVVLVGKGQK
jgi:hypothetical protein